MVAEYSQSGVSYNSWISPLSDKFGWMNILVINLNTGDSSGYLNQGSNNNNYYFCLTLLY